MKATAERPLMLNLLTLSRFDKYNPTFTTFAGGRFSHSATCYASANKVETAWSALLAGAAETRQEHLAPSPLFTLRQTVFCVLAAYLFCGAGMVWNDWIDRDIDANVARTKNRPLASGKVTTAQAFVWMALQVIASCVVLHVMLDGKDV
ncbi:UbiA prenyltransferase family protein [Metarhizium guizhouense ARSEF 977]|uniref:UbiA prenyltransferase family protein n=1 Tax=Metarhizium guizhouense (strain ARSEF 977) TaxID=1276136 RepID=A0A0B4GST8_METGA|nr:UbiA prenyltransferase family protein [Metarhizium guizhouense ARSEF 977]